MQFPLSECWDLQYINNKLVDKIEIGPLSQGQIGLLVNNFTGPTDVIYYNAKVWKL
jgi:hypothetical protein